MALSGLNGSARFLRRCGPQLEVNLVTANKNLAGRRVPLSTTYYRQWYLEYWASSHFYLKQPNLADEMEVAPYVMTVNFSRRCDVDFIWISIQDGWRLGFAVKGRDGPL